jgi:hypothetical protein
MGRLLFVLGLGIGSRADNRQKVAAREFRPEAKKFGLPQTRLYRWVWNRVFFLQYDGPIVKQLVETKWPCHFLWQGQRTFICNFYINNLSGAVSSLAPEQISTRLLWILALIVLDSRDLFIGGVGLAANEEIIETEDWWVA